MNILDEIVANKRREVEENKMLYPTRLLERSKYFSTPVVSLSKYLMRSDKVGIIAEIKRQSPSAKFNTYIDVEQISIGYMQAGASALSVLTDKKYFNGSNEDLKTARKFNFCPILRKDFIVDEYQIVEAKSIGADTILLIAAILKPEEIATLSRFAQSLGLEVLLEVHTEHELRTSGLEHVNIVGVNNRNLDDFSTNIATSETLLPFIPHNCIAISESGIDRPDTVCHLRGLGFRGFLIGGHFMRDAQPHIACANFIRSVQTMLSNPVTV